MLRDTACAAPHERFSRYELKRLRYVADRCVTPLRERLQIGSKNDFIS